MKKLVSLKENGYQLFILFFLGYLVLSTSLLAQNEEEVKKKPEPISTADIIKEIENTANALQRMNTQSDLIETIAKIEEKFPDYSKTIDKFKTDQDMRNLNELSTSKLGDLKQKWLLYKTPLKDWQGKIEDRSGELETQRINLLGTKSRWEVTQTAAKAEKVPSQMLNRISQIIKEIKTVETKIRQRLDQVIRLQNKISDKSKEIEDIIAEIDDLILTRKTDIFIRDSDPLWQIGIDSETKEDFSIFLPQTIQTHKNTLISFYQDYENQIIYHVVLFIAILAVLIILRQYGNKLIIDKEAAEISKEILNHPYSVALLVALLLTAYIYPRAPNLVSKLAQILSLIPVVRLLPVLTPVKINRKLILFIALYFLNLLYVVSSEQTLFHRIYLLLITLLFFIYLFWIMKNRALRSLDISSRLILFGALLIRLFFAFMFISIISNIMGNVTLSSFLTVGSLTSCYIGIIVITGSTVIVGLSNLLLSTKIAFISRIVRVHPQKTRKTIAKFIYVVFSIIFFIRLLDNFRILDLTYQWLSDILSQRWQIGSIDISLGDIVIFIFAIYASILISRFIRFFLEEDILVRMKLPRGVPAAISMLTNYLIIGFGFMIALSIAGFDLNRFAIIFGALGVGIGFGLQGIVNNFISGLILIFERPIQVGDVVELNNLLGTVKRIGIRSSNIRTFDGAEVIVPNANLIANEVTNWTLSDRMRRIRIDIGAAYGTDPNKVLDVLRNTIKTREEILDDPEPMILFEEFGESSLNFSARFWIGNSATWLQLKSEMTVAINNAFKEAGIEIPFPQRDLHLRSVEEDILDHTSSQKEKTIQPVKGKRKPTAK